MYKPDDLKLGSQPRGMDILKEQNIVIVGTVNDVLVIQNNRILSTLRVPYVPSSISVSQNGHVAVGGSIDNKVHIYELQNNVLVPVTELEHLGAVTDVSYSPDDNFLVACDANRKVVLYTAPEYKVYLFFNCIIYVTEFFVFV